MALKQVNAMATEEKVAGTFPCGQQLVKYSYKEKAECKAHEENGSSWQGELPKEQLPIFKVQDA